MSKRETTFMKPNDAMAKNAFLRYALTLVLLVVIVGGIAWVTQYLPSRGQKIAVKKGPTIDAKPLIIFATPMAIWENRKPTQANDGKNAQANDQEAKDFYPFKDVEAGDKGQHDFLFKNVSDQDVELLYYSGNCDCTRLEAAALPSQEIDRLYKEFIEAPADPRAYRNEPAWQDLPQDPKQSKASDTPGLKTKLLVKAGDGGAVRVAWIARKAPGQKLDLSPSVYFQSVGDPSQQGKQMLYVPVMMRLPFQVYPKRIDVGELSPGKTAAAEFKVWSSTRRTLQLQFNSADPLLAVEMKPLAKDECAKLEKFLITPTGQPAVAPTDGTRVLTAYHVTIKVHEAKDGKQLDHGQFLRKFPAILDGIATDMYGPEVIGRVQGDIQIGGANDTGRIRFKSFDAKFGSSKTIQLGADAKLVLERFANHPHQPPWLKVNLTREEKQASPDRRTWRLEVVVSPETRGARTFAEPDAVVLRIVGTDRLVRIPLEGQISGGR